MARKPRPSRAKGLQPPKRRKLWQGDCTKGEIKTASINTLREVRENKQFCRLVWPHEGTFTSDGGGFVFTDDKQDHEPLLLDLFTASAILAVYQQISDDNKAKFDRMIKVSRVQFFRVANFCLERIK